MQQLVESIPDVATLLALEPEELGAKLLYLLRIYSARNANELLDKQVVMNGQLFRNRSSPHRVYPLSERDHVELAITEAWAWLEAQGLIIPALGQNSGGRWRVLSRRAARFEDPEQFARYDIVRRFPKEKRYQVWVKKLAD
jgi:hypothetical protein